ncbi:helix-turn-helix domain-containing protein [Lacticaseibacillus paracasei]|uniref:S24 family peptidase n=1 Tax=Lacticaseibacillus paracasei TaxID=1597 RepID=UPI00339341DF
MFAKNLKYLRAKRGYDQQTFAGMIHRSVSTISEWESGKYTPKAGILADIANIFGVKLDDMMNIDLSKNANSKVIEQTVSTMQQLHPARQQKVYTYAEKQLNEQKNPDNVVNLDEARAERNLDEPAFNVEIDGIVAAGYGAFNDDRNEPMDTVKIPDSAIPSHYDYCFKVVGDSMHPTYDDGEFVFVQKTQDVTNGMIAVVDIDDMTFIKKLIFEQGRLCLRSLNDDVDEKTGKRIYPDFYADETDIIDVIGKVVGSYAFK